MSVEPNTAGDRPRIDATAYVHPSAVLIGNVRIGPKVHVGPCAIIRADEPAPNGTVEPIDIGAEASVQDGVVLHALAGTRVTIGPRTSLAHGAVVHGPCTVGRGCFIGFNSVAFSCTLGDDVVVMHGALIEGVSVPHGLCVPSMATVCRQRDVSRLRLASPEALAFVARVCVTNIGLAQAALSKESIARQGRR
jgi:carbonic anhydrase/acetyltransferase-like protein (isoleucine patch superfamily)